MKRMMVLVLGVLILMLCIMPGMAKEPGDAEEDRYIQGANEAVAAYPDRATAGPELVAERGGIDTQSPVLDGSAYTNYDTIFVHGINVVPDVPNSDISVIDLTESGLITTLIGKTSSWYPYTPIYCPLPSYQLKTGGIQPKVRYIAVEYASGFGGYFTPEVYWVTVYNGHSFVTSFPMTFSNNGGYSVQVIDLGGWYSFNRGLNLILWVRNAAPSAQGFCVAAYGARFEW